MNLENQVCSLELSKRLEKLGVNSPSFFAHFVDPSHYDMKWEVNKQIGNVGVPAYTVAELSEILFQKNYENLENMGYLHINTEMIDRHEGFFYRITNNLTDHIIDEFNQANALAKLLIYLIERKEL